MPKTAPISFILNPFRSFLNNGGIVRIFAWLGFSMFTGALLAAFLGKGPSLVIGAVTGFLGLLSLSLRREADFVPVVLISVSLAFSLYVLAFSVRAEPWLELAGQQAKVRGQLLDYSEQEYQKYYYRLRVTEIEWEEGRVEPAAFTLRLSSHLPIYAEPYDELECTVGFYAFESGGLYSSQNVRLAQGIPLGAYLTDYGGVTVIKPEKRSAFALIPQFRHNIERLVNRMFPEEEAALINAMLLGKRSGISADREYDFRRLGASHILVVSGLHMSVLTAFLGLVLKALGLNRWVRCFLCSVGILAFLVLLGFPFSATRSGIMLILFLLADCSGAINNSLNSLGLAVFLICLANPLAGGDLGFSLSVFAALGIAVFHPKIYTALKGKFFYTPLWRWGINSICTSLSLGLSVTFATLPIQLLVFGGLPLMGPISSLLLVFPCTILLYLSTTCLLLSLSPFFAPVATAFVFASGFLAKAVLWAAEKLAQLPLPFGAVSAGSAVCLVCFLVTVWAFMFAAKRKKAVRLGAILISVGVFGFACFLEQESLQGELTLAVADAGEDSCVVLMKEGKAAVLALGGRQTSAALSLLDRCNIRDLELLYLSDDSWQGWENARRLLRSYSPQQVLTKDGFYLEQSRKPVLEDLVVSVPEPGEAMTVMEDVTVVFHENRVTLWAEGIPVMIETGGSGPGSCGLLITNQLESQVNSPFTVLQTDDIIGVEETQRKGFCLLAAECRVTRLRLKAGEISFRQDEN